MPTLSAPVRVHETVVLDSTELAPGVVLLGVHAPELARVTRPGQFVMVVPPRGEDPATALGIYEAEGERASFIFFICGKRTQELAELRVGARMDCFGPLGNGFDLSGPVRDVAIVAGGVGIASVLLPAQHLLRAGARVRLFYGARTAELLVESQRFAAEGCEVTQATDDGSIGHSGYVTEALAGCVNDVPDLILACGPSPMLREVARVASRLAVRAQLALEETFACGVGGCWGCVVPVVRSSAQAPKFPPIAGERSSAVYARICKEGPVFWAHELRW